MRSIKERLLVEIREDEVRETLNDYEKRTKKERKRQWTQKQLHGQFIRQTKGKASGDRWAWLRKGCLKRISEASTMAALEQTIRNNNIKAKIDKTQENR